MKLKTFLAYSVVLVLTGCANQHSSTSNNTANKKAPTLKAAATSGTTKGSCVTVTKFVKKGETVEMSEVASNEWEETYTTSEDGKTDVYSGVEKGVFAGGSTYGPDSYQGTTTYVAKRTLNATDYELETLENSETTDGKTGEVFKDERRIIKTIRKNADGTDTILTVLVNGQPSPKISNYIKKKTIVNDHTVIVENRYLDLDAFKSENTEKVISRVRTCTMIES